MVKQCKGCKHSHLKAVSVKPAQKVKEKWECDKGHKIENPHSITNCKDFEKKKIRVSP